MAIIRFFSGQNINSESIARVTFFFGLQSIFAAAAAAAVVHVYVSGSLNSDNVAICMFDGMTRQHYINESYHEMNDGFCFLRFFFVWFIQSSNSSINDFIAVSYENREKKIER